MKRRDFIKTTLAASASALPLQAGQQKPLVNAYYFRAHMYTCVPKQIREDMKWMADIGTDVVSVAILEQDLFAAVENVDIIINEAAKQNMQVFAVPSRWAGLLAGAPKVPSLFSVKNPQTWLLNQEGTPHISNVSGVMSSIHYPETVDFFHTSIEKMLQLWDLSGIIWDEPKAFCPDFSPKAIEKLGENATPNQYDSAFCDFFSELNAFIKSENSTVITNLFVPADKRAYVINECARIKSLDYFGCDGRPWYNKDGGKLEGKGKVLLGKEAGERIIPTALRNKKKSLYLIENHNMAVADNQLMDKRLPDVLSKDVDQFIYYYYPRNVARPDENMNIIKKHIKNL